MIINEEAVDAAANQMRSQLNDFTTPDLLMKKRARMVLLAAIPYALAPGNTFADMMARQSVRAKQAKHEPAHQEDPQCSRVAGCDYGQELRCGLLSGHSGRCDPS